MAVHTGSEGILHIGTDLVGELKSYSFSESATMIDTTKLADTAQTFVAGTTSWNGSAECHLDETDVAQNALSVGATAVLKFYFEGASTGDKYYTGSAIVESVDRSGAMDDIVSVSFSFRGTGALTLSTV